MGRGEIVAYAGPNGAGKSTTVKLLAGLLAPDAGTVRALGLDPVRDRARYVGRIGVVFGQRTELWWDHPVAASFEWKRVVWDIPRPTYERMLGFVTEVLDLRDLLHSLPRELSLGQKMRADLAMALLHQPDLLFLDEPTLGLDVLAKRHILAFIKELNRERRVTVMVTSHDMSDLEELAGRIVMIHPGRIAFDGAFDELRRPFADRRRLILTTGEVAVRCSRRRPGGRRRPPRVRLRRRPRQRRRPAGPARRHGGARRRDPSPAHRRRRRRHLRAVAAGARIAGRHPLPAPARCTRNVACSPPRGPPVLECGR